MTLGGAGAKTGHLDAKTRELIALAVAISLRCDGCITVHAAEAKKLGVTCPSSDKLRQMAGRFSGGSGSSGLAF
jgi:AhpD family alkylhydroperoxidase